MQTTGAARNPRIEARGDAQSHGYDVRRSADSVVVTPGLVRRLR
jgi:hypothetical protein